MPHPEESKSNRFSKYDSMSTPQLQQLLWEDSKKAADAPSDTDELLYIMELLAQRRTDPKPPEKALADFQVRYYTSRQKTSPRSFCRRLASLAAVISLVFVIGCSTPGIAKDKEPYTVRPVSDSGYFYLECISGRHQADPYWRLYLVTSKDPSAFEEYDSMQECMEAYRITVSLAPKQFPLGYEPEYVRGKSDISGRYLSASYVSDDEHFIHIRIKDYDPYNPSKSILSGTQWEEYESNGITYYLFWRYDHVAAMWVHKGFECTIFGSVSMEELKMMIDSIGE